MNKDKVSMVLAFFTSDNKNAKRDLLLIFLAGTVSYVLDVYTARDKYSLCATPKPQLSLFAHHVLSMFGTFGWLSRNRAILVSSLFLMLGLMIHWACNNNKCQWTRVTNEECGGDGPLRNIFKLLQESVSSKTKVNFVKMQTDTESVEKQKSISWMQFFVLFNIIIIKLINYQG